MSIHKLFNIERNINEAVLQTNFYTNYIREKCSVRKIRLSATTIHLMCGTEKGENLFLISNPYSAKNFAELIYLYIYNKKQRINSITILDKNWMLPLDGITSEKLEKTITQMYKKLRTACKEEKLRSIFMIGFGYDIIDGEVFITPHFHGITFRNDTVSEKFRKSFSGGYFGASSVKFKEIKAKEDYTKEENLLGWIQYMCFQFPKKYTNREKGGETSYPLQQGKKYRKVMQLLGSITFNKIAFGIGRQEKQLIHSINIVIQGGVNAGQEFIRKNNLKAIFLQK